MKKILSFFLGIALIYSCSTSTESNGNANTTVVPLVPSNLTGAFASTTQINLSWTDNSTNETGFKIERKTGTGAFSIVGTTGTNIATFNDIGLIQGTTYTYRVYSYNSLGNSLTYSNEFNISSQFVTICNQTWMRNNLNVSQYKNGDVIPQVSASGWANLTTGAWCYYNNDPANELTYGKLYNWYAVVDPRGLAPEGWHVPTKNEWTTLIDCLGGSAVAGVKMKETGTLHWLSPNTAANNISGFTGLPGGWRVDFGDYSNIGIGGFWWSRTEYAISNPNAYVISLHYNDDIASTYASNKHYGFSVRCVKD